MPSSAARAGSMHVDGEPVALGHGAGLARQDLRRDVVGGAVVQAAGQVGALADDDAALGRRLDGGQVRSRRDQNQFVERRRGVLVAVAIDRRRLELALHDAAREQLGGRDRTPVEPIAEVSQPDGEHRRRIGRPGAARWQTRSRSTTCRVIVSAAPAATTSTRPARSPLPRRESRPVPLGLDLPESGQRGELAAGALVQLGQGALEPRLADEWDGENLRWNVPGLIADYAQLHAQALRPRGSSGRR